MKLSVGAFFGSFNKSAKEKKSRSITRSDASTASSSSSNESPSSRLGSTPRSVLRPPGKLPSAAGSDDLCLVSPASSSVSDLFAIFDRNGDGKITPRELEAVLRRLGVKRQKEGKTLNKRKKEKQ